MDLLTRTIYLAMRKRVKQLESYPGNAEALQCKQLKDILWRNSSCAYLRNFNVKARQPYSTFQKQVPVVSYEDLLPYVERMLQEEENVLCSARVGWFAKSSGTSGSRSKFIPVPRLYLRRNHFKGGADVVWTYLRNHPESTFFRHKGFVLGGSHAPSSIGGRLQTGDLSAILLEHMPKLGESMRVPGKKVILMDDWEKKLAHLMPLIAKADVGNISGVPSWMLMVLKRLMEYCEVSSLHEIWPSLEVFFHGGISFLPYRSEFEKIAGQPMNFMETYNASEGFFALQDDPTQEGMLLLLDHGIFYEFLPLEAFHAGDFSQAVPLWGVKEGVPYAMLITTLGGLYRYALGDVVSFCSRDPYRLKIVGRTKRYINAFGEELMAHNAELAMSHVCVKHKAKVTEFTAGPIVEPDAASGYHQWVVAFADAPEDLSAFAADLDAELRELNSDYDAKRYKDMTLKPLRLKSVAPTVFYQWLGNRGKLGGQHKVPRLSNDPHLVEELLQIHEEATKS